MNINFFSQKNIYKDSEFLPSALEIIETPLPPGRIIFMMSIVFLFLAFFVWSFFGRIDITASAIGKIQPQGSVKVVESLISGKVDFIDVKNGNKVNKGDVLVKFESSEIESVLNEIQKQYYNTMGEISRRRVQSNWLTQIISMPGINHKARIIWSGEVSNEVKLREEELLSAEVEKIIADGSYYKSQVSQNQVVTKMLREHIFLQRDNLFIQKERGAARKKLFNDGIISKDEWLNSLSGVKEFETHSALLQSQLAEKVSQHSILQNTLTKYYHDAIADNQAKLRQAELQLVAIEAKLQQAKSQLNKTIIRSPATGIVTSSILTTQGQVISPGETIMNIVPIAAKLEIVAYVSNTEIGFIKEGQEVDIKVDTFPFTRYGTIPGEIVSISNDAVNYSEAAKQLEDSTSSQKKLNNGLVTTQGLVYKVVIRPERSEIKVEGKNVLLLPGMGVVSEIKTGRRSVISYLLGPLNELSSNSLRER